jgi:colicin import membrane protein
VGSSGGGRPAGLDEQRLAALYAGPLEDFVVRRGELARELAQSGAKDAAGWVKSLPKPVATAWAVNRVAHERAEDVEALRRTGDDLRRAQAAGDRDALRRATEQRRTQVQELVEKATETLQAAGHQASLQAFQRVRRTFEAIAAFGSAVGFDPPVGRLHADLEPPGFETLLSAPSPPQRTGPQRTAKAVPATAPKSAATGEQAAAKKIAAARRLELQRAATAAAERVGEARVAVREAESVRERAERRLDETERSLARQEERLREARAARDAAAAERKAADRDAAAANKVLEKRRAELAAAQDKLREP